MFNTLFISCKSYNNNNMLEQKTFRPHALSQKQTSDDEQPFRLDAPGKAVIIIIFVNTNLRVLSKNFLVGSQFLAILSATFLLLSNQTALALQTSRSDQTLNLRGLYARLSSFFWFTLGILWDNGLAKDIFANIVILGQVEKATNFGCTLRTQRFWDSLVSKTFDFIVTLK